MQFCIFLSFHLTDFFGFLHFCTFSIDQQLIIKWRSNKVTKSNITSHISIHTDEMRCRLCAFKIINDLCGVFFVVVVVFYVKTCLKLFLSCLSCFWIPTPRRTAGLWWGTKNSERSKTFYGDIWKLFKKGHSRIVPKSLQRILLGWHNSHWPVKIKLTKPTCMAVSL